MQCINDSFGRRCARRLASLAEQNTVYEVGGVSSKHEHDINRICAVDVVFLVNHGDTIVNSYDIRSIITS